MKTSNRHPNVLGLCSFTHDSAAALISGGRLTGMAEEERLSGVKHTREYPAAAVEWLLREAGLTAADIGTVAYNFAGHRYLAGLADTPGHLLQPATRRRALPRAASLAVIHHRYRQRMSILHGLFPNARVQAVPHHTAHGLYAFAASGFTDAAVLIIDSLGETCTTSIGSGQVLPGGGIRYRITESLSDPASLGYAYGAVTMHLGWRRGDEEGTVMALAATGDPARFRGLLARAIPLTPLLAESSTTALRKSALLVIRRSTTMRYIVSRNPDPCLRYVYSCAMGEFGGDGAQSAWLVRGGEHGQREARALAEGLVDRGLV